MECLFLWDDRSLQKTCTDNRWLREYEYNSPHYILLSPAMNAVGACIYHLQNRMEHGQTIGMRQHSFHCQQEDHPSCGGTQRLAAVLLILGTGRIRGAVGTRDDNNAPAPVCRLGSQGLWH